MTLITLVLFRFPKMYYATTCQTTPFHTNGLPFQVILSLLLLSLQSIPYKKVGDISLPVFKLFNSLHLIKARVVKDIVYVVTLQISAFRFAPRAFSVART